MGLSAGQARLLTITARLTDNEYRSQQISNAKMRLSTASNQARIDYQDALNNNMIVYNGYDINGVPTQTALTANVLYEYLPLKNQYALKNAANQILVSYQDARNYQETETIVDFLDRYGVLKDYSGNYAKYQQDYTQYLEDMIEYESSIGQYTLDKEAYDKYLEEHAKWEELNNVSDLYTLFSSKVGTSNNPIAYCYEHAIKGEPLCYLHLLNMMLDYDGTSTLRNHKYPVSCDVNGNQNSGATVITNTEKGGMFTSEYYEVMKNVSDGLNLIIDGEYFRKTDGDDRFVPPYNNGNVEDTDKYNLIQAAIDAGRTPTALEILRSDYIYDAETNSVSGLKSLKQKTIDMYYIIVRREDLGVDQNLMTEMLINFTEGDLKNISFPEPEFVPDPGEAPEKPIEPEAPSIIIDDKEKTQWYVNLWYRMNGSMEAPKVQTKEGLDDMDEYYKKYILEELIAVKNEKSDAYKVIDAHLATSSVWLEDVLSQGIITMERIETDEVETKYRNNWTEMIYSNGSEFSTVEDDAARARAEAQYNQTMREIEFKDKKYQIDINKLDTEHNTLQSEYESVKSEVSKNVERSYKTFQG